MFKAESLVWLLASLMLAASLVACSAESVTGLITAKGAPTALPPVPTMTPNPTFTAAPEATDTPLLPPTPVPSPTPVQPTNTPVPPTNTPAPPTKAPPPPPPTNTLLPPTETLIPPTPSPSFPFQQEHDIWTQPGSQLHIFGLIVDRDGRALGGYQVRVRSTALGISELSAPSEPSGGPVDPFNPGGRKKNWSTLSSYGPMDGTWEIFIEGEGGEQLSPVVAVGTTVDEPTVWIRFRQN